MARRAFTTHPLVVREVTVRRILEVTPRMRRIVVGGEQLGEFEKSGVRHPAFSAPGFDDHLKLIFTTDGDIADALPRQLEHGIEWGPSAGRAARDYTPRAVRSTDDGVEVDLDFVLHGDGPAASWASSAAVGDSLWFVGPKSSTVLPDDLDWVLLGGDETALPAIGRYLDERPHHAPVRVVVTIPDRAAVQQLALRPDDQVTWVEGPAGALEAAIRSSLDGIEGDGYLWAGSESAALLPVRRYAQRELSLPRTHVNVIGYWHEDGDHTASAVAESTPVAEVQSPLAWFAVRAALQLALLETLTAEPDCSLDRLAERAGVASAALAPLLPVLRAHAVIQGDDEALRVGPFGDVLIDDEHERAEFIGLEADALLALTDLAESMRAERAPWVRRTGSSLAAQADSDAEVFSALVEEAESLAYLLEGFVADGSWAGVGRAVFTGPGAAVTIDAVRAARGAVILDIHESPVGLAVLRDALDAPATVGSEPRPGADLIVAAFGLAHRDDQEARAALAALSEFGTKLVVIEASRPDGLSPHAAEVALLTFAQTGAGPRDTEALGAIGASAGWRVERVTGLGWGVEATWFTRDAEVVPVAP